MRRAGLAAIAVTAVLTACQTTEPASGPASGPASKSQVRPETTAAANAVLPAPQTPAADAPAPAAPTPAPASAGDPAPHVYMALQPGGPGLPISVVFAIDAARDGTPSDDPAVRLTPDDGLCNPQEMRHYAFPPGAAPVVSETDQAEGLTAAGLPEVMAVAVTDQMLAEGLAQDREETRALNICTRKLWERLVEGEAETARAAGQ